MFQIQCDRLTIHTTQLYLSMSFLWFPPLSTHTILAVFWVFRAYSPCLSILLQSLFTLRRLHSASYPFTASGFQSGSCLPPFLFPVLFGPFCQFLDSAKIRWFQLQSMRVRNHSLLSNPTYKTTVPTFQIWLSFFCHLNKKKSVWFLFVIFLLLHTLVKHVY